MDKKDVRILVRGVYNLQKLRIQMGNRIVNNFKAKLGQAPSKSESEELDAEGKRILKNLRMSYKKLTDGVTRFPTYVKFEGDELISTFTEFVLINLYLDIEKQEVEHFSRLGQVLQAYPIYTGYLKGVKGIGPAMAGVIISEFDIRRATYPSSLWMYAGLDVAPDGAGRSKRKAHLIDVEYVDKEGDPAIRKSITFNPFIKTKLLGVLGPSFIKTGNKKYSEIYYGYKNRLEQHPKHKEKTKGHRHNMAMRYMIKQFLVDLYNAWREMESLPVAPRYEEAKLGIKHREPVHSE